MARNWAGMADAHGREAFADRAKVTPNTLHSRREHQSPRRQVNERRRPRSGCGRSTKGTPREVLPRLREGLLPRSDSQTGEPSPYVGPRLCCHASCTQLVAAPHQFYSPSARYGRLVCALEAVDQRCSHSRSLFGRKAQHILEKVVYTGVHVAESSSHRSPATPLKLPVSD